LRGVYERETQEAVDKHVKPGFICYDLGASIGYLSLLMARKARQVFAFEPAPHAAAEIRRHMAANGIDNITIIPSPVSNDEREVSFVLTDVAFGSSINETETRWPIIKVRTTTLDRFLEGHPGPDFIKIDIEGEEGRVLAGARTLLAKHRPVICCELHSVTAAQEVQDVLREFGYSIRTLDGRDFTISGEVIPGEVQVMCLPNEIAG
jgi:FkbM family methyltransferase